MRFVQGLPPRLCSSRERLLSHMHKFEEGERGQDFFHLHVCGTWSMKALRNHDWVNSLATATELLNLLPLPQSPTIPLHCCEQQLSPYTFSGQLQKAGEQNCIWWKQKRVAPQGVQVQREFLGRSRGRMTMCACSLLTPGTLVRSQEQRGHCTHPAASGLGGFIPIFH